MNKLLLASLASIVAVAGATPARAHPTYHYLGGCEYFTVSDGTDSPQTQWDGEINVVAVATDAAGAPAAVSITVECELRINGATPGTIVYSASGTGVAVGANQFSFNADPDDVVTMCDNVSVGGEFHKDCGDATSPPTAPVDEFVYEVLGEVAREIDGAICDELAGMSGGPADQPPLFDVRDDGDLYVSGAWFWNCPPYGEDPGPTTPRLLTACSDGIDNDGDSFVDYPADRNCTSYDDPTEAPVRRAVGGHITLIGNYLGATNTLRAIFTGDFDPLTNAYTCELTLIPAEVTCTRNFDPEVQLHCTHFILSARAPGRDDPNASGFAAGRVTCDTGNSLQTRDVNGRGTEVADNTTNNNTTGAPVNLGTADRVVCRAPGVGGAQNPIGSFEVDCWEPGVQWPLADEPPLRAR